MSNQNATGEKSSPHLPPNVFSPSSPNGHGVRSLAEGTHPMEPENATSPTRYEFVDCRELARRLTVPASWIYERVRTSAEEPLPHVKFGKYVRFLWGSPALERWIAERIVMGNNRRLGRTRRKEQE